MIFWKRCTMRLDADANWVVLRAPGVKNGLQLPEGPSKPLYINPNGSSLTPAKLNQARAVHAKQT